MDNLQEHGEIICDIDCSLLRVSFKGAFLYVDPLNPQHITLYLQY